MLGTEMKIVLYIILGIVGVYLLLVIPAGIAVFISSMRFKRSPHRDIILSVIQCYQQSIRAWSEEQVAELVTNPKCEKTEQDDVPLSVVLSAKALRQHKTYKICVSVGKLRCVTIGHAETMELNFSG